MRASGQVDLSGSTEVLSSRLRGNRRVLAQAITALENGDPAAQEAIRGRNPRPSHAHVIGITGPPGVGKSSLVSSLAGRIRVSGRTVGILAVDPSSPFSGGALLGDRVRMAGGLDDGLFFRSMASRSGEGGLAATTGDVLRALDLAGFDVLLVETVGVGQAELAVVHYAHTVVVVTAPDQGDDIQTYKAGILEIADVLALNKADREGAKRAAAVLRGMTRVSVRPSGWERPVIETVAPSASGIDELIAALESHRQFSRTNPDAVRLRREWVEAELAKALAARLLLAYRTAAPGAWERAVEAIVARRLDPVSAAEHLVTAVRLQAPAAGD